LKDATVSIPGTRGGDGSQGVPPPRRRHPVQRWLLHLVAVLYRWAESGRARSATATWGFAQSAIVPGPDLALLIPLGLADPKRVFSFALWTTAGSFFGTLAAYSIGVFAFENVGIPLLSLVGIGTDGIQHAREMFAEHTMLVVLVGSLGLVPAKVMSITAGGFGVPLLPFALVFLAGRSARYFIVATIIRFAGARLVRWIERRVGRPLATLR
jgi:membrane protein YqaA with SNARE-associated domain